MLQQEHVPGQSAKRAVGHGGGGDDVDESAFVALLAFAILHADLPVPDSLRQSTNPFVDVAVVVGGECTVLSGRQTTVLSP